MLEKLSNKSRLINKLRKLVIMGVIRKLKEYFKINCSSSVN